MNHKSGFNALSRTTAHRRAMSRNMVTSLFRYERITTTKAKALEVRKVAEKLITRSKVDTVHNRRQAARFVMDKAILTKLFNEIGPRMADRNGGYTRVLKLGFRQGDSADMAILELVDFKQKDDEVDNSKKSTEKAVTTKPAKKSASKSEPTKATTKSASKKTADKAKTTKTADTSETVKKTSEISATENTKSQADKTEADK
ncbi:MAG TPA: 50S ribosomal protein L17 [Treponemataceae bacterium]|nr:50S ribosomal protein L17 [Treponemataceae bacterium]